MKEPMKECVTEQENAKGELALMTLRPSSFTADEGASFAPGSRNHEMRVLHIVSGDRWAGAEVQVFTLLKQLHRQVNLHVIIMNPGELVDRCSELGIPVTPLDESRLSSLQLFNITRSTLRDFQPHVVHTHRQKENIIGSLANLFSCRAPSVRTVHGAPEFLPNFRQKLQRQVDTLCGKYLQKAVIAVSTELKDKLISQFGSEQLQVIVNGIDPEEVQRDAQPPLQLPGSDKAIRHVGLVGRVEAVKRPDLFLNMAALLLTNNGNDRWRFHIFGDGSQLAATQRLAEELGISQHVQFHGHRRDIRRGIAALDAVVMSSDHEGLPMTALETVALGVRLVAHDTGGLSRLLREHQQVPVSDHSAQGYAEAVLTALSRPAPETLNPAYLASNNACQVLALYQALSRPLPAVREL